LRKDAQIMKHQEQYSIFSHKKIAAFGCMIIIMAVIGYLIGARMNAGAEDCLSTAYVMCKPGEGHYVNVRATPSTNGAEIGRLESGDWFRTDGESRNGWIRCYGVGECAGWIYSGFVVTEEPRTIMENYVCTSNGRVACRRWIGGPQVDGAKWIKNGSTVTVFYIADDWACTSRGYIRAEFLEVDPE